MSLCASPVQSRSYPTLQDPEAEFPASSGDKQIPVSEPQLLSQPPPSRLSAEDSSGTTAPLGHGRTHACTYWHTDCKDTAFPATLAAPNPALTGLLPGSLLPKYARLHAPAQGHPAAAVFLVSRHKNPKMVLMIVCMTKRNSLLTSAGDWL